MHAYSGGNSHIGTHVFLGALAVAFDICLIRALTPLLIYAPLSDILGIAAFFCISLFFLLELVYTTVFWRFLKARDKYQFSGTYEECTPCGEVAEQPATLRVWQYWNTIEINFNCCDGVFKSVTAAIVKDRFAKGDVELIFSFQSSGSHRGSEREGAYFGTFILKRANDDETAEALYFTESKRANFRQLMMKRKPRDPS